MQTKEYVKLFWYHNNPNEPRVIIYEVDLLNDRYLLRLIDIYADGRCINNGDPYEAVIEVLPLETVEELNMCVWREEFRAVRISQEEFEEIWNTHIYSGSFE
ncbi:MAG: hypothetical protein NC340_03970 [Ruminococcus flavefaciens]|nr:hypothetical protein [Ruminococcus flavefaciens]MCM1229208.1 hypothetical protein [Ruminococcus flavefaciens]